MTLFNCYNYGSVLQAFATYAYIKKIEYKDIEFINYENDYESKRKQTFRFLFNDKENSCKMSKKI